ncbi:hypothetical protein L218DRAFT_1004797 [Marasmius fiardii PR-910]|nr:hypothetical protein L218DRAFT_1004797 [Marasmius fiardii PR-910]
MSRSLPERTIDICGDSSVFDINNQCVRNSWTSLVPASFVLALCLVSSVNTKSRSPFRRFLTLKAAEALVFRGDEHEGRTATTSEGGELETVPRPPAWKTIMMVFIGLMQVGCRIAIVSYTLFISSSSKFGTYQEVWNDIRPLLVAFTFTVVRRIQRPTPTAPLDLFAVYVLELISGVVELGGFEFGRGLGGVGDRTFYAVGYSESGKSIAPEDHATLFSWLSYTWIHPLISRGKSCTLNESDVPNLSPTFQSRPVLEQFMAGDAPKRTLLTRILKANSSDLMIDAVGTLNVDDLILSSIDKDAAHITPADRSNAYIYTCLMFLAVLTKTQVDVQHLWFGRRATTRIRSELMATIYDKALKRKDVAAGGERNEDKSEGSTTKSGPNNSTESRANVGKVVNLMAGDANTPKVALDRIADFLEEVGEQVSTLKAATARSRHKFDQFPLFPLDEGWEEYGLGLRNATLKWNGVKDSKRDIQKDVGKEGLRNSWFGSLNSLHFRRSKAGSIHSSTTIAGADATGVSTSSSEDHGFELKNISVMFPDGELTVVTGPTASGKTALLMAVLGEMTLLSGELVLYKNPQVLHDISNGTYTQTISYASQTPWLRHQTIKENILFGSPYEERRYRDVVEACTLRPDFDALEDGDETEIGARGVSLSGGQKARVALARAVYARTKYVLLDDPLSAVDSHTSRYLYENLLWAYYLVRMLDGRIDSQGKVKELKERGLLEDIASEAAVRAECEALLLAEREEGKDEVGKNQDSGGAERKRPVGKLVNNEHRQTGSVKWTVYKKYLQASSYYIWVLLALLVATNEFLGIGEKVWMMVCLAFSLVHGAEDLLLTPVAGSKSYRDDESEHSVFSTATSMFRSAFPSFLPESTSFCAREYMHSQRPIHQVPLSAPHANNYTNNGATGGNGGAGSGGGLFGAHWPSASEHPLFYIGVYASIGLGSVLVNLCSVFVQLTGGLRASMVLFKQLLEKVVRATFRFHDTTPQGRMLNRFGKDMETIDITLSRSFQVPQKLAKAYLNTSRDLRRMESNSRSPIFSHFGELLEGIVTVRAFSVERDFMDELHKKVDDTTKMWYSFLDG